MDMIADAEDSPRKKTAQTTQKNVDSNMENSLDDGESSSFSDSDGNPGELEGTQGSPEQIKINRQRKKIEKVKMNIGKFFKDNMISDLLPYN